MSEEVVRLDFDAKRDGHMVQLSVVAYDEDFDTAAERAEEQLERYKNRLENSTPNEELEALIERRLEEAEDRLPNEEWYGATKSFANDLEELINE